MPAQMTIEPALGSNGHQLSNVLCFFIQQKVLLWPGEDACLRRSLAFGQLLGNLPGMRLGQVICLLASLLHLG